jgi:hypothetical protein
MSKDSYGSHPHRTANLDLSMLSQGDLQRLKDEIIERSRQSVDPHSRGFSPLMMATDDDPFQSIDDMTSRDWMESIDRIVTAISSGATRIGLSVVAAGSAIAASSILAASASSGIGLATLAIAGASGLLFAVSAAISAVRRE